MQKGSLLECKSFSYIGEFPTPQCIHDRGDPYDRLGYQCCIAVLFWHYCVYFKQFLIWNLISSHRYFEGYFVSFVSCED